MDFLTERRQREGEDEGTNAAGCDGQALTTAHDIGGSEVEGVAQGKPRVEGKFSTEAHEPEECISRSGAQQIVAEGESTGERIEEVRAPQTGPLAAEPEIEVLQHNAIEPGIADVAGDSCEVTGGRQHTAESARSAMAQFPRV